jgi:hypothetical protein
VITGETPPAAEESVYAPIAVEGLPTLQGFAPLAAAAPAVVVEEPAVEALVIVEEPVVVEPTVAEDAPAHDDSAAARDALHIPSFEALLDTPTTDWSTPAQPPAVQEIWDMVDDLLGLPHHDVTPGHATAEVPEAPTPIEAAVEPSVAEPDADANESKRHGWLRNRKG